MSMKDSIQVEIGSYLSGSRIAEVEEGVAGGDSFIGNSIDSISNTMSDNPTLVVIAGATLGLAIGAGLEYSSLKKIESNRQKLSEVHGDLVDEINPNRNARITKSLISLGAVGGLALGTANALNWTDFNRTTTEKPNITLIVDKSYKTLLPDQDSAIAIRNLVGQFEQSLDDYSMSAQVAIANSVRPMDLGSAANIEPFGSAPISDAFDISVSAVNTQRDNLQVGEEVQNSAIALVTNGNGIESSIFAQNLDAINAPVYVVNVSEDSINESSLRSLSEATGGEYYSRSDVETTEERRDLVSEIGSKIESTNKEEKSKPNWPSRIALLALSLGALAKWKHDRPKLTSNFTTANKSNRFSDFIRKNK